VVNAPHLAGSAKAGEHFVSDHEPVVLVTHLANSLQEVRRWNPVAAFGQTGLNHYRSDVIARHEDARNVIIEVPETVVDVLILFDSRRHLVAVGVWRLDHSTGPRLQVAVLVAAVSTDQLAGNTLAMKRRAERNDVATFGVRKRQVDSRFSCLRPRNFVVESR